MGILEANFETVKCVLFVSVFLLAPLTVLGIVMYSATMFVFNHKVLKL